jgi:hypothetical protein
MLSRARKVGQEPSNATAAAVGPGAYEAKTSLPGRSKFAMAPFGSTSTRSDPSGASHGPGPGTYDVTGNIAVVATATGSIKPSSQFASTQSRIAPDRASAKATPGPGTYIPEILEKPSNKGPVLAPSVSGKALHSAEGINWVKVATAPSIPSHVQSYGYEEGENGALVQQPVPYSGFGGRDDDKAGPGDYNPSHNLVRKTTQAPNFGKLSGGRVDPVPVSKRLVPGPGTYKPEECGKGDSWKGGVTAQRQLSSFASTSQRGIAGLNADAGEQPGPGQYKPPQTFQPLRDYLSAHPESCHSFGRSNPHDREMLEPSAPAPGPGQYYASDVPTAAQQQQNNTISKSSSAFASASSRFGGRLGANPGPGTYDTNDITLTSALRQKPTGRTGCFGSTAPRFSRAETGRPTSPGPAAYASAPVEKPIGRRRDKRSSAFRSHTVRSDNINSSAAPGKMYDAPSDWSKPTTTSRAFISSVPRFADRLDNKVPGPGHYSAAHTVGKTSHPMRPSMPRGGRFEKEPTTATEGPGPGTYDTTPSMIKKTYNISIGGVLE